HEFRISGYFPADHSVLSQYVRPVSRRLFPKDAIKPAIDLIGQEKTVCGRGKAGIVYPVVHSDALAQADEHTIMQRRDINKSIPSRERAGRYAVWRDLLPVGQRLVDDCTALKGGRYVQQRNIKVRAGATRQASIERCTHRLR